MWGDKMDKTKNFRNTVRVNAHVVATTAILIALALVLTLVEQWIPLSFSVPGIRLGIANVATVFALYLLGPLPALVVLILRCILGAIFSGTFTALLFSLCGGLLAFLAMWLLSRSRHISPLGVCVGGAGAHNIGQILAACLVLGSKAPLAYLPLLLLVSIATGLFTGILCCLTMSALNGGYYLAGRIQLRRGFRPDPQLFEEASAAPDNTPGVQPDRTDPVAEPAASAAHAPSELFPSDETYDDFINSDVWEYVNSEYEEKPLPSAEEILQSGGETYDEIMARIRADFENSAAESDASDPLLPVGTDRSEALPSTDSRFPDSEIFDPPQLAGAGPEAPEADPPRQSK